MDGDDTDGTIWFLGDPDDPWIRSILDSIASLGTVRTVPATDAIPVRLFDPDRPPRIVILHRWRLTLADVSRLEGWRREARSNPSPRIILCYGPYVRYAELERSSQVVDLVIPEATAVDTLPRHILRLLGDRREIPETLPGPSVQVEIVTTDHELRGVLREACSMAGLGAELRPEPSPEHERRTEVADRSPPLPRMTLWDVPVLDPHWPEQMERRSRLGPVIALFGFADRQTLGLARTRGAAACLEVPFDLDDLVYLLDRIARSLGPERSDSILSVGRVENPHTVPPPPVGRIGRARSSIRGRGPRLGTWPDGEAAPKIEIGEPSES
jgi:hypothetical protein